MKKILFFVILLGVVGGGYYIWRNKVFLNNKWVKDETSGEWMRRGNPQGVPPREAIENCYQQASGRTYDAILQKCLAQLCGSEPVCINGTLDVFNVLRSEGLPSPAEETPPETLGEEPSAPTHPTTTTPTGTDTEETIPVSSAPETEVNTTTSETAPVTPPTPSSPAPAPLNPVSNTSTLRVTLPEANASLTSPFTISGETHETVTALAVRVKGGDGQTLIQERIVPRAAAADGWRPFKLTLAYSFSRTKSGTIEVVPEGGDDKTAVVIPVEFK